MIKWFKTVDGCWRGLMLVFLLCAQTSWGYAPKGLAKAYKKAKKHYAMLEYEVAMSILAPLIDSPERCSLSPYMLFYYALAAYHNGEVDLAEATLTRLADEFPDWEQCCEVWYWLGLLRFEGGDYDAGLGWLARLRGDGTMLEPAGAMKRYFLSGIEDVEVLKSLFEDYPEDDVLARVLFDRLLEEPLIGSNIDLLADLKQRLNFSQEHSLEGLTSLRKARYNVAVFFPFFVDEVDYEDEGSSNEFVIALYQGIQAAVSVLAEQGIEINLFAYDTKKDAVTTANLLAQEEVKGMDLIIGPLYPTTIPLVTSFAQENGINLFNPLSENSAMVGHNPFVFLFKASLETQACKAAAFTLQDASPEMRVGIVHGTSREDVIKAKAYEQYIEDHTGEEVALMRSITPEEAQGFLAAYREAEKKKDATVDEEEELEEVEEEEEGEMSVWESLTHIYVASKDALIVSNVLSVVEMLGINPCLIGDEGWLRGNVLTLEQLQGLRPYLVAPSYVDYRRESVYAFREQFYDQFGKCPTYYACTGYDMMLFLGRMLGRYGVYFQRYWGDKCYVGDIFSGVSYGQCYDNQYVPIVSLQGNSFVICDSPGVGE